MAVLCSCSVTSSPSGSGSSAIPRPGSSSHSGSSGSASSGGVRYGEPVTLNLGGFNYEVSAGPIGFASQDPDGSPEPPGSGRMIVGLRIKNMQGDRPAPVPLLNDDNVGGFYIGVDMASRHEFHLRSAGDLGNAVGDPASQPAGSNSWPICYSLGTDGGGRAQGSGDGATPLVGQCVGAPGDIQMFDSDGNLLDRYHDPVIPARTTANYILDGGLTVAESSPKSKASVFLLTTGGPGDESTGYVIPAAG